MTTLSGREATALLVIDVQTGVVARAHDRERIVGNIAGLVERAREAGTPVIWVQHESDDLPPGSDVWNLAPELSSRDGEPTIAKRWGDAFEATALEAVLQDAGVGRLIVCGAQTDACIRATLHGAFVRGYDVTLVADAHTTDDLSRWGAPPPDQVIAHTNLYWAHESAPGRTAAVVKTQALAF